MADDADRIVGLYQRRANEWDRERSRSLFERSWLDRFIALLPRGGTVLDIGCGAGEPIARYLVEAEFAVTGIDSAPAMIALCEARLPGTWIAADMRNFSLGRRFDGLLAWDSFFHLRPEQQRAMFQVFADHATAQAALMFTSGPGYGSVVGEFHGEQLYHASLDPDDYRALPADHGFAVAAHEIEDPHCGGHTIWLARRGRTRG